MMQAITGFLRALIRDDRGAAVAEYSMIVTVLIGLVLGLMALGTNVSDCMDTIGSLLRGLTGHY
jgi:Flp pilus assembly pilin Flp